MPRLAAITYDGLPMSSGGAHTLRTRGFIEATRALSDFVSSISVKAEPVELTLELVSGEDLDAKEFSQLYDDACSQHGVKKFTRGIGNYSGHQWALKADTLHGVAAQLETLRPISMAGYAGWQVVLHATWRLDFRDTDSTMPLPYQDRNDYNEFEVGWKVFLGESGVYARISEKSTAAIFLSLPFEEISPECEALALRIQEASPVRLSAKHWKRWSLTKTGNSYLGRKISSPIIG